MTKHGFRSTRVRALTVLVGAAATLGACSSSAGPPTASQSTSGTASVASRSACSLLTISEAEAIVSEPISRLQFCSSSPSGHKSQGLYLSTGAHHTSLVLTLSWPPHLASTPTTTIPGSTETIVSGTKAYWSTAPATSTVGGASGPQVRTLTASKQGFVVSMATENMTDVQVIQAMSLVLGHL